MILYPATSENSLISSSSFPIESVKFPMSIVMSSVDKDTFTSSFPIGITFFLALLHWMEITYVE